MSPSTRTFVEKHQDRLLDELKQLLRIPSISAQPAHAKDVMKAAQFVAASLTDAGMEHVEIIPTAGHPLVYADWLHQPGKPTVLCYGHYDVQPPDPLDEWHTPPFEPTVRDGNLYARGACDDKGQMYSQIKAVEALRAVNGTLPVNLKFLIEGEEETGGEAIAKYVAENPAKLKADVALVSDTELYAEGIPTLCIGLRGLIYTEIEARGPSRDLHSGQYGGAAPNAVFGLVELLSKMKDANGHILIPGMYDDVKPPSPEEKHSWSILSFSEEEFLKTEVGSSRLTGEPGFSVFERLWARPTLEVHGIAGGYTAPGAKTVIPAKATAKVSMRMVPDQDPDKILAAYKTFIKNNTPAGIQTEVRVLSASPAISVKADHPAIHIAAKAFSDILGRETVFIRIGGSIPIVGDFATHLGIPTVLMGFGLPDDGLHSPNEKYKISNYYTGIMTIAHFLNNTAAERNTQDAELASSGQERLVRSAGVVSLAVFMSRITGLLRESVMARLFGAGKIYDAFMLGFRIPNLTRDLFAEGALSSAFVPIFTEYLTTRSKQEAGRLVNLVGTALIVIVGALCAAGIIFAPALVHLLAPGYAAEPEKFQLAVSMTRVMFPFLLLVALAALVMGVLNANNKFGVPALASTFFNLGSVGFGIMLGVVFGPSLHLTRIEGMAIGVVLGGALQLGWQLPSLYRLGYRPWPAFHWSDPGMVRILRLMVPAILGNAAVQINVMVNTNFASTIHDPITGLDGPVSWLSYAFRFMQLPLGLFGVAMASATLPSISRSAAAGRLDEFRQTLSHSLGMVFLLTLPSSIGLVVLGKPIIGAIYQSGRFHLYDTEQTARALSCYAIGLTGYAAIKVLSPAFYALGDARTPMLVSLASILVNYAAASSMIRLAGLGHAGLALSTSAVALFGFLILFGILRVRIGGIHGRALVAQLGKVAVASVAMAALVALSSHFIAARLGVSQLARLADLAVSIPLGLGVYYGVCRWLGVSDIDMAVRAFTAPIRRRLRA